MKRICFVDGMMSISRRRALKKANKQAKYVFFIYLQHTVERSVLIQWLKERGCTFDVAYTSVLKRAIKTLYLIQEELDLHWTPVYRHWRLNERVYGDLQGKNKAQTVAKYGEDQVKVRFVAFHAISLNIERYFEQIWRRAYDIPPPPLDESSEYNPKNDPKYQVYKNLHFLYRISIQLLER